MSKELATANQTVALPTDTSGLKTYANTNIKSGNTYLKVNGKTGDVTFGKEDNQLPDGAQLVALIGGAQAGYIEWEDGQAINDDWIAIADYNAENMRALREGFGQLDQDQWERDSKGRPIDPISESVRVPMLWLAERKPLMFSSSSNGGCNAVKHLIRNTLAEIEADQLPIVEIEVDSYPHKKFGEVFYPVFRIVGSKTPAQIMQIMNGHAAADSRGAPQIQRATAQRIKAKKR